MGVGRGNGRLGVGRRAWVWASCEWSRCPKCESANSVGLGVELGGLAVEVNGLGGETVIGKDVQSRSLATQELGVLPPR